ncbi:MAG: UDP-4-amino-4,6-dideoxy-N-acetyl-beta-L-altrosamine transaminase [Phycisphaerales bacterium]|nr:MAG: UDP-4-amino-4,6-dideoxy-N-acetyl-beta-L-altrosamine transaminase [Phycisphaerales bacterium]
MKNHNKTMLITGISGLLGNNLAYYFRHIYDVVGQYCSHQVFIRGIKTLSADICSKNSFGEIIAKYEPDVVLHCASLTDIDFCENHKELTKLVNSIGTSHLVQACKSPKIKLVYISTDSVYDGSKGNSKETDKVNSSNYYGVSKAEGEQAVLKKKKSVVLRTNIFGWNIQEKYSIAEWILYELLKHRPIKGFKNVYFSSIYTFEFARIVEQILSKELTGIYNCASKTSLSKYEFACALAKRLHLNQDLIEPIDINDFPFTARRGKNLTMNVDKLSRDLGVELPTIEQSLDNFCRDYTQGLADVIKSSQRRGKWYPQLSYIPYGRQSVDDDDIAAVVEVLKSSNLTQGGRVTDFEQALCDYTGARFAVAVNSGTSALHIACLAAAIKEGDEVMTSPITFVASANCAVYCGAVPVFADIDNMTYNMLYVEIERKITERASTIIPVHFAGQSCDMETISRVIRRAEKKYGHKVFIIEDASHALGSRYKGTNVGSCTYSDMAVMSFHPVKHITTGEGGVIFTNDEDLYKRLKIFRSHGITSDPEEFVFKDLAFQPSAVNYQPLMNPWYYEQMDLGYNYRITDIQCALGLSQLRKLGKFRKRRRKIVNRYNEAFSSIESIQIPFESSDCDSNFHLYVLLFNFDQIGIQRAHFMNKLKERGIQTQVHYIPVHTQPYFQKKFATKWGDCPNAEEYYQKCLSIPLFPAMTELDVERVINEITHLVRGR